MQRVLDKQFSGGWGASKDEITIWATQQSIEFLDNADKRIHSRLEALSSFSS